MYGRGNYAPQFGQGLQRPMPPYQQSPAGHPAGPHFQPGQPFPPPPLMQQGGPPLGGPPRPGFPHGPPAPPSFRPQGPPGPLQAPLTVHGGASAQHPFSAGQQNFGSGNQHPHHVAPLPPPPSVGPPRIPPPPPSQGSAGYGPSGPQSISGNQQGVHHLPLPPPPPPTAAGFFSPATFGSAMQPPSTGSQMLPQPPPPPPSSPPKAPPPPLSSPSSVNLSSAAINVAGGPVVTAGSDQVRESESSGNVKTDSHNRDGTSISDEDLSLKQRDLLELPAPPPKPADEKVVRNIEVLCQFIAKNGPGFEEMALKNESGNPEFSFLVGGDPGSEASRAREYYLWMKKKCAMLNDPEKVQGQNNLSQGHADVEPSANPSSFANAGAAHSPADSDVDMEDDITQSDKEQGVYDLGEHLKPEPVSTGEMLELQNQKNALHSLQYSRDSDPALKLSPPVKSQENAETKPENSSVQAAKIDSPFRLIQNYASDDTSEDGDEPCREEGKSLAVSPPRKSGASTSLDDVEHRNTNSKSGLKSDHAQLITGCPDSVLTKELNNSEAVARRVHETIIEACSPGIHESDDRYSRIPSNSNASFHGKYDLACSGIDTVSTHKDTDRESNKNTSATSRVDEFGRLAKEGASESESDDSRLRRRSRSKRNRSRSRSRSPSDRRRRRSPRRSPRRRKDRRSRSRSWSPKRRRSRSRSPYRPGGDHGGENLRRGKLQTRECFDFLKGRCYRGASCRYLHHDADKIESSRSYKTRQHQVEAAASSRNSDYNDEAVISSVCPEANDMKSAIMPLTQHKHGDGDLTSKIYGEISKAEFSIDAVPVQRDVLHEDVENIVTDVEKCGGCREGGAQVEGALDEQRPRAGEYLSSGIYQLPSEATEASAQAHQRCDDETPKMDASTRDNSSTIEISAVSPLQTSVTEPDQGKQSNEPTGPSVSKLDSLHQISHLPPPPLPSQTTDATQDSKLRADYNLLAPPVSFPPPLYQSPFPNQQSHYPVPPNSAWGILPTPQPRPPHMIDTSSGALQFQQSQIGGYQQQMYHSHSSNMPGLPFSVSNVTRDDGFSRFPPHGPGSSISFVPGMPPQPGPFSGDSTVKNMQSFPGNNLLVGESSKPSIQNHQFPQQRPPPYGPPLSAADSVSSHFGGSLSVPAYASDHVDKDHSSRFLDVGGSRISAHYNPYASTFDQPVSSRFSSAAFTQERDAAIGTKFDSSFGLNNALIDGQTAVGHGSRQIIASPNALRAGGHTLPRSGGDQYDPLFDSMEPSSGSLKNRGQKQDHAADNSDIMLKLSSRHIVLDVAENNKQKEIGAVVATTSPENDEYGETADAEVGAVEDGSASSPNEDATGTDGEIEIDQLKPEGRSKKSKDSRSMKLFKVAVANFVKEVLKPQWRQGNMSKEVFKTIVKKTVDKVSGAMKNHRVPKSQAKIDHYIDSSRRKLTQLVEGYVSKYKS